MANWTYTIDIKDIWKKYSEYDNKDYDNDKKLFKQMKDEIVAAIAKQCRPNDYKRLTEIGTIDKLKKAKHLSSFNKAWDALYDYCDYNKIWLSTNF